MYITNSSNFKIKIYLRITRGVIIIKDLPMNFIKYDSRLNKRLITSMTWFILLAFYKICYIQSNEDLLYQYLYN